MKVAVYLDSYRPEDGGAFTMQGDLFVAVCGLAKEARHEFVVVSAANDKIKADANKAGLAWMAFQGPGIFERLCALIVRLVPSWRHRMRWRNLFERRLRAEGVDFVWFVGPKPLDMDLPYMAIVLDLQHRKQPWFPEVSEYSEWATRERLQAPFLRRAAAVIVGTQVGKEEVVSFFQVPPERIFLLPHPTPAYALEAAHQKQSPLEGLPPGYLFYPAQFWAHKNHVNLLLALKQLKDEGLRIPLVLVGSDFGNKAYVEETIEGLGLGDQVTILGFVDTSSITALYQNALALTYVTFFGPENLPPLEAFAMGCPVIASDVDGAFEQFGDAAMLVDPTKPEDIAAAIRKVHSDEKLRHRLVSRGSRRATSWTAEDFVRGAFGILDGFEPVRRAWKS